MKILSVKKTSLKTKKAKMSLLFYFCLLLTVFYPFMHPNKASAAVTEAFVRFDRLATSAAISGTACLKTGTSGTETNVVIVFPQGWTISSTASNWTVSTTNLPTDPVGGAAATAWPGIGTATSVSGLSVVFPGSDLSTATFYCFNFAGASSTVGSAGNDKTGQLKTQGGSPYVDSVDYSTSVVASGADQITVSASVSATMTFSLNTNSVALGTLSTGSVTSGSVTETISTNARNGWISWVKGTNSGGALHSTVANADITSPSSFPTVTDLASATGYVLDADAGTGTPTINSGYNGTNTTSGGHIDNVFHEMATKTTAGSGDTVTINVRAKIAATQAAATDYSDTLTVSAAGSF